MAKAAAPKKAIKKSDAYAVDGAALNRVKPFCPKCGPGTFMATHKDRKACGKCGYTEFNQN